MALANRATSSKGKDCRGVGEGYGAQTGKMTIPIALSIDIKEPTPPIASPPQL
jgi:hypothetical protein